MKNKNQVAFLGLLIVVAFATLAFVILPTVLYGSDKQVETPAPNQVVQAFYEWYLAYEGNPLTDKAYRSSAALSDNFIYRLDEQAVQDLIADPFLCAQDVPESVAISSPEVSNELASVEVQTSLGNRFTVRLVQEQNAWKITEVVCE